MLFLTIHGSYISKAALSALDDPVFLFLESVVGLAFCFLE